MAKNTTFPTATPVSEAVEIRFITYTGGKERNLTAYYHEKTGTVGYNLTGRNDSTSNALTNLNVKDAPTFPRKALAGWQKEVIAFAKGVLGTGGKIIEIR